MRIMELRPGQRLTQIRAFAWLIIGIYLSHSVCMSTVGCKIPGEAKLTSITRRLSRLLDNPAIRVREWYEPIARQWLEAQLRSIGEIRLVVDGTKIGFGHQLLIVCLAYRKRSIPIAWTRIKHVRGHSTAGKQLALLSFEHLSDRPSFYRKEIDQWPAFQHPVVFLSVTANCRVASCN